MVQFLFGNRKGGNFPRHGALNELVCEGRTTVMGMTKVEPPDIEYGHEIKASNRVCYKFLIYFVVISAMVIWGA